MVISGLGRDSGVRRTTADSAAHLYVNAASTALYGLELAQRRQLDLFTPGERRDKLRAACRQDSGRMEQYC